MNIWKRTGPKSQESNYCYLGGRHRASLTPSPLVGIEVPPWESERREKSVSMQVGTFLVWHCGFTKRRVCVSTSWLACNFQGFTRFMTNVFGACSGPCLHMESSSYFNSPFGSMKHVNTPSDHLQQKIRVLLKFLPALYEIQVFEIPCHAKLREAILWGKQKHECSEVFHKL